VLCLLSAISRLIMSVGLDSVSNSLKMRHTVLAASRTMLMVSNSPNLILHQQLTSNSKRVLAVSDVFQHLIPTANGSFSDANKNNWQLRYRAGLESPSNSYAGKEQRQIYRQSRQIHQLAVMGTSENHVLMGVGPS
jgi:hypothetical protein